MQMLKKCRMCKENLASSKEHLITNSRLNTINKNRKGTNDNNQKTFKNITCKDCNNLLGKYEYSILLRSHITLWKILAGNINDTFNKDTNNKYKLENTLVKSLELYEKEILDIILQNIKFKNDKNKLFISAKEIYILKYNPSYAFLLYYLT